MYDAITFFRIGSYIQQQGVTGAGNLFVKMVVFETIGLFRIPYNPAETSSGQARPREMAFASSMPRRRW